MESGRTSRRSRFIIYLALILIMGIITVLLGPKPGAVQDQGPPVGVSNRSKVLIYAAPTLFFTALVIAIRLMVRDPVSSRALARSDSGDTAGAIADICAQIEKRGARWNWLNTLGCLQLDAKEYTSALATFEKAETLPVSRLANRGVLEAILQVNKALALKGLGRIEEALERANRARELAPGDLVVLANRAMLLAELGRMGEAGVELRAAQDLPRIKNLSRTQERSRSELLGRATEKVTGMPNGADQAEL